MKKSINFIISNYDHKKRVDVILVKNLVNYSRNRIQNFIKTNNLKINNLVVSNPSKKVNLGDRINLKIPKEKQISLKPYDYNLDIIHEDSDLIVLNKRSGISIHPGPGNHENTIVNALIQHSGKNLSNIGHNFRPGIVHRLDKNTSGLVLIAKTNSSHNFLAKQFKEHSIERVYYAIVWGKIRPTNGKIDTLITRSSQNRKLMEVGITKGKRAITNYKTIEIFKGEALPTFSLVECKLETGRTHQIRVHLTNKGNPILGDKQYKKKFKRLKNIDKEFEDYIKSLDRQLLHAKSITFNHPNNNKRLNYTSILPERFNYFLKKLRNT